MAGAVTVTDHAAEDPREEATIVFFGDSITFGQYIDPEVRWTALLESHLRATGHRKNTYCVNRGVSGETTREALVRFPADVQRRQPDLITIQFGLNDCNCWDTDRGLPRVSARSFEANLEEMVTRARWFGCEEIILCTNHRTVRDAVQPNGQPFEENNRCYNEIVRGVAATTGAALCDMERAFARYEDESLAALLLPYPDQLHLSESGNRVYFESILPSVDSALKRLSDAANTSSDD